MLETRASGQALRRRRVCTSCSFRFTTLEVPLYFERKMFTNVRVLIVPGIVIKRFRRLFEEMLAMFAADPDAELSSEVISVPIEEIEEVGSP